MEEKAQKIIDALRDRYGFNEWYYFLDDEIKQELKDEILAILSS